MKPSIKQFTKIDGNTTYYSIHGIKANARRRVEQDADLVEKNLQFEKLGQPHDDVLLTTDRQFRHYKANEDRIIFKDALLFRKYYGQTGSVKYYQILIPMQLVNEVLRSLHGETIWNYQNENRIQRKVLLPKYGSINQGVAYVM